MVEQVHVDASVPVAAGVGPAVQGLLEQPAPVWRSHRMLLQRGAEVALVQDGQLQSVAVVPQRSQQQAGIFQPQIHQVRNMKQALLWCNTWCNRREMQRCIAGT